MAPQNFKEMVELLLRAESIVEKDVFRGTKSSELHTIIQRLLQIVDMDTWRRQFEKEELARQNQMPDHGGSKKILIVDDSSLARRTTRRTLELLVPGVSIEEATDGVSALERHMQEKHDVVFLDQYMSGMLGLEVLKRLRTLNPNVRVIMVTADTQATTAETAKVEGAAAVLSKPYDPVTFKKTLIQVLREGGGARPPSPRIG